MSDKVMNYGLQNPVGVGYAVPPANEYSTSPPGSVEDFSARINASIESAWSPQSETTLRGFVGAVVKVAKEGIKQSEK
ncbi:MAG TPA: hypothetical protein VNG71_08410 [Pyrinomonadaceae bacterium]|nr:hypothetical protein [Pyrinomonadaceae bacterium]